VAEENEEKLGLPVAELRFILKSKCGLDEEMAKFVAERLISNGVHVPASITPEMFLVQSTDRFLNHDARRLLLDQMNAAILLQEHRATMSLAEQTRDGHENLARSIAEAFQHSHQVKKDLLKVSYGAKKDIEELNARVTEVADTLTDLLNKAKTRGMIFDGKNWVPNFTFTGDVPKFSLRTAVPAFSADFATGEVTHFNLPKQHEDAEDQVSVYEEGVKQHSVDETDLGTGVILKADQLPMEVVIEAMKTGRIKSCVRDMDTNLWEIETVPMLPAETEKFAQWAGKKEEELHAQQHETEQG